MTTNGILQMALYLAVLLALVKPLGGYINARAKEKGIKDVVFDRLECARLELVDVTAGPWYWMAVVDGAKVVISQHPRRCQPRTIDEELYKWRHLIENYFCKLKEFKGIAMRADKTDESFSAMICLAAAVINSR